MRTALRSLGAATADLPPVGLAQVLEAADLQTRTDRKYFVPPALFECLVDGIRDDYRVLEIDERRVFRYESVYFDTPDLAAYLGAARGRRHKFKVRTRTYLDSGTCVLEVKTSGGRGETVKERMTHSIQHRDWLDSAAETFIGERVRHRGDPLELEPTLTTTYARTALVDLDRGTRVTCDADLALTDPSGNTVAMQDHVLVETKSAATVGDVDRILWRLGVRPARISKYCVGLAALDPSLPANRWHRTLRRHFGRGAPGGGGDGG
jgi:hypothetical protein